MAKERITHDIELSDSTIAIGEPTASEASVLLTASRGAHEVGNLDRANEATEWILERCVNLEQYEKLNKRDQLKVIETIIVMATGTFAPKS